MTLKKEIKVLKAENQLLREHAHIPSDVKSPRDSKKGIKYYTSIDYNVYIRSLSPLCSIIKYCTF